MNENYDFVYEKCKKIPHKAIRTLMDSGFWKFISEEENLDDFVFYRNLLLHLFPRYRHLSENQDISGKKSKEYIVFIIYWVEKIGESLYGDKNDWLKRYDEWRRNDTGSKRHIRACQKYEKIRQRKEEELMEKKKENPNIDDDYLRSVEGLLEKYKASTPDSNFEADKDQLFYFNDVKSYFEVLIKRFGGDMEEVTLIPNEQVGSFSVKLPVFVVAGEELKRFLANIKGVSAIDFDSDTSGNVCIGVTIPNVFRKKAAN